jgi:hypothetical protein
MGVLVAADWGRGYLNRRKRYPGPAAVYDAPDEPASPEADDAASVADEADQPEGDSNDTEARP